MNPWIAFFLGVVVCQLVMLGVIIWDMRRLK